MCRHCQNLVEDRYIVHKFMDIAARRLSEKLGEPVHPNELEVEIHLLTVTGPAPPIDSAERAARVLKMLDEMYE